MNTATTSTIFDHSGQKSNPNPAEAVAELLQLLQTYTLDPTFEDYGNFIDAECVTVRGLPIYPDLPGAVQFWGNFANLSHVLRLGSNDPAVIGALTAAILANQETPAYAEAKRMELERVEAVRQHQEKRAADSRREMLRRAGALG